MLRRNLLYTAMTRARSLCIVVGDPRAVERAISRADAAHRWTGLEGRVRASFVEALGATVVEAVPDPA
jgi:exodeoxyribonuclease V alpha subunit